MKRVLIHDDLNRVPMAMQMLVMPLFLGATSTLTTLSIRHNPSISVGMDTVACLYSYNSNPLQCISIEVLMDVFFFERRRRII